MDGYSELFKGGLRADLPGFGKEGWTLLAELYSQESVQRFRPATVLGSPTQPPGNIGPGETDGGALHAKFGDELDNGLEWKFHAFFSGFGRENLASGMDLSVTTFELDFQVGKDIGRHQWLAGARHRNNRIKSVEVGASPALTAIVGAAARPTIEFPAGSLHEEATSAFLQDTFQLADNVYLLAGTKFEDNVTGGHWMPSARAWCEKDPNNTFWAAYSNAMQLPSYDARAATATTLYRPTGSGFAGIPSLPNAATQPAELEQWEIGWRHLASENFSVDATAFHGDYELLSLVGAHRLGNSIRNSESAESYGGEIALNWKGAQLSTRTSISYADTQIDGVGAGTNVFSKAKWRGSLSALYRVDKSLRFNLGIYAAEKAFEQVPGYIRTDAGVTWSPGNGWETSLQIQNAFDPLHPEHYSAFTGPGVYEVPRTVYLQARKWF